MKPGISLSLFAAGIGMAGNAFCQQPNIVLIMADDMGFSDLSCYGSEIPTPNIDRLAQQGVRFTHFKNTGRSCPTRACLLTGQYQHTVGMGWMTAVDEHRPGYRGEIDLSYPTIAEMLKAQGYSTYMSGKWHGTLQDHNQAPNGSFPTERGFDRYYGCLEGGGSYYRPKPLYRDLVQITDLPEDYYYTRAITEAAVEFVRQHPTGKPMFLYVAHYAPHLPLQAPQEIVAKYRDLYKKGYDSLRQERFERQKAKGMFPESMELPVYDREFGGHRPAWKELTPEQQEKWVTDMATYAAMIEVMDQGIGEVIEAVEEKGMLENTVFLFLSDNGASNENGFIGQLMADLSNTPYRSYKQWCFQGGTSTPFIFCHGGQRLKDRAGQFCLQTGHVIDLLPTCLELAGAKPDSRHLPGKSLLPAIAGAPCQERVLYFEHQGSCAIIAGDWKLVRANRHAKWELIDLQTDPFELHDLSDQYPGKVKQLEKKWRQWAEKNQVFPLEDKPWGERIKYYRNQQ